VKRRGGEGLGQKEKGRESKVKKQKRDCGYKETHK